MTRSPDYVLNREQSHTTVREILPLSHDAQNKPLVLWFMSKGLYAQSILCITQHHIASYQAICR